MALIDDICQSIIQSDSFRQRFKDIEVSASEKLLLGSSNLLARSDIQQLLLQSSVLAFGEELLYKKYSQKINALLYDLFTSELLVNYALQVISSRLGNFPVVGPNSQVFADDNLFRQLTSDRSNEVEIDLDLASGFLQEEEIARLTIADRLFHFNIFQAEVLRALDSKQLVSFSAPTSFGKSFIVRHHIARQFAESHIETCLIIVPTKSLIDDFFESLLQLKAQLSLDYEVFTHTRTVEAITPKSIYVLTQERLSYLISNYPDAIRAFDLVYCDEAHYIARGYRGFLLRNVLRQVIDICSTRDSTHSRTQFVFSSPIIKNPEYYKEKLFAELNDDDSFHKEILYSPVEKSIFIVTKELGSYRYALLHDTLNGDSFDDRITQIGDNVPFPNSLAQEDADEIKRDVSILQNLDLQGGTICYTTSPLTAHKYSLAMSELVPEETGRFRSEIDDLGRYISDHYDDSFGIVELMRRGIGLHYGPMPVGLRRAIVSLFLKGALKHIFCTPTLLEGVNLPAKNLVLFSERYGGAGGREKHSALSFWNLLGRAGRVTYGLSGNVFCIQKGPRQYQTLLESRESTIDDPESNVLQKATPRKHFERTLLSEPSERFDYLRAHSRNDIEYLLFELFTSRSPETVLMSLSADGDLLQELLTAIRDQRDQLTIPDGLLNQNPGIDPRLQDSLYVALQELERDTILGFFSAIANPLSITGPRLFPIVSLTETHLGWPLRESQRTANRLTQWLREMPISEFIQQRIRHIDSGDNIERIKSALRVISELETEMSFCAPKYLKCFFDIASAVAVEKGIPERVIIPQRVDGFLFAVESGISSVVGRYLFENGISRPIAIKVHSLVSDLTTIPLTQEFFIRDDVQARLRDGLSSAALREVAQHLQVRI